MEKITLGGKEFRIGFDFSTLLAVEDEFGKGFSEVLENNSKTNKDNLRFLYACIKAFNPDVEPFNEWIHCISNVADMTDLNVDIVEHQKRFFATPASLAKEQTGDSEAKND